MPATHRWHSQLLARLTAVQPRQAPWTVAARNSVGVLLPLVIGLATGHVHAGLGMATGALTVMFSDQPGLYAERFRRLLLASAAGALAALIGFTLGGHAWLMLPLVALWTFAASLLVALGPAATRVGLTSIIVLLITSSRADPAAALPATLLILGGGLLQTLLAVMVWPLDRHRPQRQMLAEAFTALSATARDLPDVDAPPPEAATINALQAALLGHESPRSLVQEASYILVYEYDHLRLDLTAMADLVPTLDADRAEAARAWCRQLAEVLQAVGRSIGPHTPPAWDRQRVERLDASLLELAAMEGGRAWHHALERMASLQRHVHAVIRNSRLVGGPGDMRADASMQHLPVILRPGQPHVILRANLRRDAIAFRHALRSAVVVGAGLALAQGTGMAHGYWLPMTAAIVLKPDFGATITYGVLRMLGTLFGLLVMSLLLGSLLVTPPLRVAALGALCFTFRDMAPRNYGIGVAALSGMLVLMLALAGEPAMQLVAARALGTLGGCLLGLAAYLAWPSWERSRVRPALAAMLEAWSDYLHSLRADDATLHSDTRSAARAARSNAQASLERLRQEPRTGEGLLDNGEAILIAGNRLARAGMRLDALLLDRPALRTDASLCALMDALVAYTRERAACIEGRSAQAPDLRQLAACAAALRERLSARGDDSGLAEIVERLEAIAVTLDAIVTRLEPPHDH